MAIADRIAKERRAGTHKTVAKLQAERTEVLVLFCRVAGLEPFTADERRPVQLLLQEFCQVLVDYIATGHFGLYERIVNGQERRRRVADLAEQLYPRIAKTTEIALDFNDKYDCEDHCEQLDGLSSELSKLGEALATRADLEDQLIKAMS